MNVNRKYLTKREIQLAELDILKYFVDICDENNITYYLYAGTALGAARHKGFIPWDDDIDIIMPRSEYEKICYLVKNKKISSNRFEIYIPELEAEPKYLFGKVFDKTIKLESEGGIDDKLWIDIFQLDALGGNPIKTHRKMKKMVRGFDKIRFSKLKPNDSGANSRNIAHKTIAKIMHFLYRMRNYEKYCRKIQDEATKYNGTDVKYYCNLTWSINEKDILRKEWLESTRVIQFEGINVKVFSGFKDYLSNRYGKDYMKLPPVEMRTTHTFKAWRVNEK